MMSTLTEIGDYLESRLSGDFTQGVNLFLGTRPDEPDVLLVVYEYPGGEPEAVQEKAVNVEKPQIQIVARAGGGDYNAADRAIHRAWNILSTVRNMYLSGTKYRSIKPSGSPGTIGRDTNDRILVSFNATVEKEVSLVA